MLSPISSNLLLLIVVLSVNQLLLVSVDRFLSLCFEG
jgi:hypothetical protein